MVSPEAGSEASFDGASEVGFSTGLDSGEVAVGFFGLVVGVAGFVVVGFAVVAELSVFM